MFIPKDIAEYYNTTQIHYQRWWDLKTSHSLHYGIWDERTKDFREAVINTNKVLMELASIDESDKVLDAGCGVGGAAIFLCEQRNARVTGITLSQKQVEYANTLIRKKGFESKVDVQLMDYTQTSYPNESFDVIWACESVSSATDKLKFIKEAYRLLKKGGRLILSDFFLTEAGQTDRQKWVQKWVQTWAVSNLVSSDSFLDALNNNGFSKTQILDYTTEIRKSAKRMYYASILAALPSELYNLLNPKVSRFAKNHYKCGIYQYKALKKDLWKYNIILAVKIN